MINLIIWFIYYVLICIFLCNWKFIKNSGISNSNIVTLFTLKVVCSFLVYLIYTRYYTNRSTADIFKLYDDAICIYNESFKNKPSVFFSIVTNYNLNTPEILKTLQRTEHWDRSQNYSVYNDNRTIIQLNCVVRIFSFGIYHVHALMFCLFSFIGSIALFKTFILFFKEEKNKLLFGIFLVPSILFWSSGILKESLSLLVLGIFIFYFFTLFTRKKKSDYIISLFLYILLFLIKPFIVILLSPSLIAYIVISIKKTTVLKTFIITHIVLLIIFILLDYLVPGIDLLKNLSLKQNDFIEVGHLTKGTSMTTIYPINNSFFELIKSIPTALFNSFFKPSITDLSSPLMIISFIETHLITIAAFFICFFFKKKNNAQLAFSCLIISFTLLSLFLIGLIVPVIGAIVRYKSTILTLFVPLILITIDLDKMKKLISKSKK